MTRAEASSVTFSIVMSSAGAVKAMRERDRAPRKEPGKIPAHVVGSVTGSGSPRGRPVASSIGTLQRLKLPPRSLPK